MRGCKGQILASGNRIPENCSARMTANLKETVEHLCGLKALAWPRQELLVSRPQPRPKLSACFAGLSLFR